MNTTAIKKDGFLKLLKPKEVELFLNKYEEDQHFDIEISKAGTQISERHRKFYFGGVIRPAAQYFKIDPIKLHEYYKHKFVMRLDEINGEVFSIMKSLGKMRAKEATIYIDNVRMDLRSPDNLFNESFDTIDPDEFWALRNEGVLL